MKTNHYYNTQGTVGLLLQTYEAKAQTQDQVVFCIMQLYNYPMSPSQVYKILDERFPITSIRRALSNLTRDGKLTKYPYNKVTGIYGRPECTWGLAGGTDNG